MTLSRKATHFFQVTPVRAPPVPKFFTTAATFLISTATEES